MNPYAAILQIGKQGLTPSFIETVISAFKHHKQVRISVLKSATRNKEELKKMALEIIDKLPLKVKHRLIGYTIILIKQ